MNSARGAMVSLSLSIIQVGNAKAKALQSIRQATSCGECGQSAAGTEVEKLPPEPFYGAGIYAIYYFGDLEIYRMLAEHNQGGKLKVPIYVGKAVPPGARKGGFRLGEQPGAVLDKRLCEHAKSISEVADLRLDEFACRYLVADDIWIPLGEQLLIEWFSPVWNRIIDGFGIHDPGGRRANQLRSAWDTLHSGRRFADKLPPNPRTAEQIRKDVQVSLEKYFTEEYLG